MLKILDVEWEGEYTLELEFSDGFRGLVDLKSVFETDAFKAIKFSAFSLEETHLDWGQAELSANTLRNMAQGGYTDNPVISPDDIEAVLKQATWDAMMLNRPDILQAAIRGYVEEYGVTNVQKRTSLKSRTSIYKALDDSHSPKLDTLIQLSHAVLEIRGALPAASNDEAMAISV